jgi:hypothetical protein
LLIGEYGVISLGLRYAIAIILPIVTTFFLAFALIEDSGYLPRLAMLIDRLFKLIGLSGRAVIPIVLGFGCDTMATLVTRTLETRRERLIATFLLALAIPCSAQLGVILGLLGGHSLAVGIWVGWGHRPELSRRWLSDGKAPAGGALALLYRDSSAALAVAQQRAGERRTPASIGISKRSFRSF